MLHVTVGFKHQRSWLRFPGTVSSTLVEGDFFELFLHPCQNLQSGDDQ